MVLGGVCVSGSLLAQQQMRRPQNRPAFYSEKFSAGVHVGLNLPGFDVRPAARGMRPDSIIGISAIDGSGLHISIQSELRLSRLLTLRFDPGYLLGERAVLFDVAGKRGNYSLMQATESDLIRFPLALRLRSKRYGNFASYMLTGFEYSLDVAGNERKLQQSYPGQPMLRMKKNNYSLQAGSGLDFFLPYFKFGLEVRFIYGLRNILVPDGSPFADAVGSLRSRMLLFSFTFEG